MISALNGSCHAKDTSTTEANIKVPLLLRYIWPQPFWHLLLSLNIIGRDTNSIRKKKKKKNPNCRITCLSCDLWILTFLLLPLWFQWNLICDKAWMRATGDALFMVGVMLGSMIFGGLSDKFGRRPIFFLSLVIQLVGGILVAVSPEFISYVIFRLIVGSTTSGVFLVAYVIGKSLLDSLTEYDK